MTCDLFKDRVGYRGQRYEVRYTDEAGVEHAMGWQGQPKGGLVRAAKLHPGWTNVHVRDLCTCNIDKTRRKRHLATCVITRRMQ